MSIIKELKLRGYVDASHKRNGSVMNDYVTRWRNKSNGKMYVIFDEGIDTTNERDGLPVIVYRLSGTGCPVFVREKDEFFAKFEKENIQD